MKTTLPLNLIRLSLFLALYPTGQLRAELKEHPWVLERHGAYVEMTEGAFLRLSAIERVKAVFHVRNARSEAAFQQLDMSFPLDLTYPLTPSGISEFKALDRAKHAEAVWDVQVLVYINGELDYLLVSWRGDDPIKNWDEFEAAISKARSQVMKLLSLASNG